MLQQGKEGLPVYVNDSLKRSLRWVTLFLDFVFSFLKDINGDMATFEF